MNKEIIFENTKKDQLSGIISNPSEDKQKPIIILCHGFASSKKSRTFICLENMLNKKKISTLRFDFYGHGKSQGKFEDITISEAAEDILKAIEFLKKEGYQKIGLVGSSFGGIASIVAAGQTKDLYVLALKSPVSNYMEKSLMKYTKTEIKEWKEKGFIIYKSYKGKKLTLNYSFFEDSIKINGYEYAKKISIPSLIVHGDKDDIVPIEQSRKSCSLMKNCKLEVIPKADHYFSEKKDFEKMLKLISEFIIKQSF